MCETEQDGIEFLIRFLVEKIKEGRLMVFIVIDWIVREVRMAGIWKVDDLICPDFDGLRDRFGD